MGEHEVSNMLSDLLRSCHLIDARGDEEAVVDLRRVDDAVEHSVALVYRARAARGLGSFNNARHRPCLCGCRDAFLRFCLQEKPGSRFVRCVVRRPRHGQAQRRGIHQC